jgi:hypothetical protein
MTATFTSREYLSFFAESEAVMVRLLTVGVVGFAIVVGSGCNRKTGVEKNTQASGPSVPAVKAIASVKEPAAGAAFSAPVTMLTDEQYPDCPDIGFRSDQYNKIAYSNIKLTAKGKSVFDVEITDAKDPNHKVVVRDMDLTELVPSAPEWVKKDGYLTLIGIMNQEWNRHQVGFKPEGPRVQVSGGEFETKNVSRVDIANNCLHAGYWEIILFSKEKGDDQPYFHGWFTFPKDLYGQLFEMKNGLAYADYKDYLETYQEPPMQAVDLNVLRKEVSSQAAHFVSKNDEFYPVKSDRQKKEKNIIYPGQRPAAINAFLTDETKFATFSPPGMYEKKSPRATTLGKLATIKSVEWKKTSDLTAAGGESLELQLAFENKTGDMKTKLIIGGIKPSMLPKLDPADAHKGWNAPMGIALHPFSESYDASAKAPDKQNSYYAMFVNEKGEWINSHNLGVDGPLMFIDKGDERQMHLYLLSFERHAFVGHFVVEMPK